MSEIFKLEYMFTNVVDIWNIKINGAYLNSKAFAQQRNNKQNEKTTHRLGENDVTYKGLVSKIYKQLRMLNSFHMQER